MKPTYSQICGICAESIADLQAAGGRVELAFWEFNPIVWNVICDENAPHAVPDLNGRDTFMAIPVRHGRIDAEVGIRLEQANTSPQE